MGVILVVALLIGPGAIGFLLTRRFDRMLMVAVASAVIAALAGTLASYISMPRPDRQSCWR